MSNENDGLLARLITSFDDFKERLIRIEENVKDVKSVKTDVEELKIKYAALESSTSSAHKRIDTTADITDVNDVEKRVTKIEGNLNKAVWIVLTIVFVAIMSLVIIS
jgi:hypothetical protein